MPLALLVLACTSVISADVRPSILRKDGRLDGVRPQQQLVSLRGGFGGGSLSALQSQLKLPAPSYEKIADGAVAGLGVVLSFAAIEALQQAFGLSLIVAPMMASTIILFTAAAPPNPKGLLLGTLGCSTLSAAFNSLASAAFSPAVGMGAAAAALMLWFKMTGCIFPPTAVLCMLMMGKPSPYSFVLRTWLPGHACLSAGAMATSVLRGLTRKALKKAEVRSLGGLSRVQLKDIFAKYDTSGDGTLDAHELKLALRVVTGASVPMRACVELIGKLDRNGNGVLDFSEFMSISKEKLE